MYARESPDGSFNYHSDSELDHSRTIVESSILENMSSPDSRANISAKAAAAAEKRASPSPKSSTERRIESDSDSD